MCVRERWREREGPRDRGGERKRGDWSPGTMLGNFKYEKRELIIENLTKKNI